MKGIFIKNWLVLLRGAQIALILMVCAEVGFAFLWAMVAGLTGSGFGKITFILCAAFPILLCTNIYECNDKCKWNVYCGSLPVGRRDTVRGDYAFAISAAAVMILLYILIYAPVYACFSLLSSFSWSQIIVNSMYLFCVGASVFMLIDGIAKLFYYKFGYLIFRVVLRLEIVCFACFIGIIARNIEFLVGTEFEIIPAEWSPVLLVVCGAVYFISMLLSERFYKTVEL